MRRKGRKWKNCRIRKRRQVRGSDAMKGEEVRGKGRIMEKRRKVRVQEGGAG